MSYFLSSLPLWQLILLVVINPTAVAMAAQLLIRKWVGGDKLAKNNEIAGFKFATVGVIYAVLLAFTVIAVWEKFSEAQTRSRTRQARFPPSTILPETKVRRPPRCGPRSSATSMQRSRTNGR